jgi:hypothetical protein
VDAYFGHEVLLSENAAPWGFMSAPIRSLLGSISGMGHERTFHTLIRHVRFSTGTRPRDAIG